MDNKTLEKMSITGLIAGKRCGELFRLAGIDSLKISKNTGISQHEILNRAINIAQTTTNNIVDSVYIVENQILKELRDQKRK
jgi:hypothetical protein